MTSITGYVEHIRYQNPENSYTVFDLANEEEQITCTGSALGLAEGEYITVIGRIVEHAVYGPQLEVSTYKVHPATDEDAILHFLASDAVKGVGLALAGRIVQRFGADTMRVLEEEPERLSQIKGITPKKARQIGEQIQARKDLRDAMFFLQKYGITNALAVKVYETYQEDVYRIVRHNPYRLAEDISGVGFQTADKIAKASGLHVDSEFRIRSGILYGLQAAGGEGHCCLPFDRLLAVAESLLAVAQADIEIQLDNLLMERKLIRRGDFIFLPHFFNAELNAAHLLMEIDAALKTKLLPAERVALEEEVAKLAKELGMTFDLLQLHAVQAAAENGVFLLSGGPGTGKTSTIHLLIRFFESRQLSVVLAAPTGRAAKRMSEATGYEAKTIHRLLEVNGDLAEQGTKGMHFERNEENPLEADVIIIDEMSMVDIFLLHALLKAVSPGTRLILVGDADQLPSVGPGQVLKDLIGSGAFETLILQRIFRQENCSDIVENAHKIQRGEEIVLPKLSRDFVYVERLHYAQAQAYLVQLVQDKLPGYLGVSSLEIQVLTPTKKGPLGTKELNSLLQKSLNPSSLHKREHQTGDTLFREGDKVMQTKNNYRLEWEVVFSNISVDKGVGVFNGDMGRIVEINEPMQTLTVLFDEQRQVIYPFSGLSELELAYAITVHKAQGSEYPGVVLPLLDGGTPQLFSRNLLYTAITRAKRCVTIVGSRQKVLEMIHNDNGNNRHSDFKARILEMKKAYES